MKYNALIVKQLEKLMDAGEPIYVSGVTSFGDKFDVPGVIAKANDGSSGVCQTSKGDIGIMVQLGGNPSPSIVGTSKGIAPFLTTLESSSKEMPDFYMLHIADSKHKIILVNPSSAEILSFCKTNGNKHYLGKSASGCQLTDVNTDPVTEECKNRIAQKVIIDGRALVLAAVDGLDNDGNTVIWGWDNIYKIVVPVKKNSTLQVENLSGKIVHTIANNPKNAIIKMQFTNRVNQVRDDQAKTKQ